MLWQILPVSVSCPSCIAEVSTGLTITIHGAAQMIMRMFEDGEGDDFFNEPPTAPDEPNQIYVAIGETHSNLPTPHMTRNRGYSKAESRDTDNHTVHE